jgi:hypothetical protein
MYCIFLCFIIVLYLEFYYTYNISLKMDWLGTPLASAARAAGNFFNANFSNPPPPATNSADEEQQITSLKKNFLHDQQQEAK